MTEPVDYNVLGAVCKDLHPGGFALGGTVTYASVTAHRLGLRAGVVTRSQVGLALETQGESIQVVRLPSVATTTFENQYDGDRRVQYLRAACDPIGIEDIPLEWRTAPIVHLGPVAQELRPEVASCFDSALVGVTPQGWMRRWDADGRVRPCRWDSAEQVLAHADVLVLGDEDLAADERTPEELADMVNVVVITHGSDGATVYWGGRRRRLPARSVCEVDSTGAGDVFAAAFLIAMHGGEHPFEAARFANCVASFSVTAQGIRGIPTREQARVCLPIPSRGQGS